MRKAMLCILLIIIGYIPLLCQQNKLPTTFYDTELEASLFNKNSNEEAFDPLLLFLDTRNQKASKEIICQFKTQLRRLNKKFFETHPSIDIHLTDLQQAIEYLHKDIFLDYHGGASFARLVVDGQFNCVTATAYLAFFFEYGNIPYTISYSPHHVFLIIEVNEKEYLIETTDSINSIVAIDDLLVESKAQNEYASLNLSEYTSASNKIDAPKPTIDLKSGRSISLAELAGLHYYNKAVVYQDILDLESAYYAFSKARLLFDDHDVESGFKRCLLAWLPCLTFQEPWEKEALITLTGMAKTKRDFGVILKGLKQLSHVLLLVHEDEQGFGNAFSRMYVAAQAEQLRAGLQGHYLFCLGKYFEQLGFKEEAAEYFTAADKIMPSIKPGARPDF